MGTPLKPPGQRPRRVVWGLREALMRRQQAHEFREHELRVKGARDLREGANGGVALSHVLVLRSAQQVVELRHHRSFAREALRGARRARDGTPCPFEVVVRKVGPSFLEQGCAVFPLGYGVQRLRRRPRGRPPRANRRGGRESTLRNDVRDAVGPVGGHGHYPAHAAARLSAAGAVCAAAGAVCAAGGLFMLAARRRGNASATSRLLSVRSVYRSAFRCAAGEVPCACKCSGTDLAVKPVR